jgi:hypothetical protein
VLPDRFTCRLRCSLVQVNGLNAHIALDRVRDSFFQKHQQNNNTTIVFCLPSTITTSKASSNLPLLLFLFRSDLRIVVSDQISARSTLIKSKQFSFITSSSFLLFIMATVDYQPGSHAAGMFGRGSGGGGGEDPRRNKPSRDHERERRSPTFESFHSDDDIIYPDDDFEIFDNTVSSRQSSQDSKLTRSRTDLAIVTWMAKLSSNGSMCTLTQAQRASMSSLLDISQSATIWQTAFPAVL